MNVREGLATLQLRYVEAHHWLAQCQEFFPLWLSFLPAAERTGTPRLQGIWDAYVATEAGAVHDQVLARLDADPAAVVTPDEARTIVRPLLDEARTVSPLSAEPLASFWLALPARAAVKWELLRVFIAVAAVDYGFHKALRLIVKHYFRAREPLHPDLVSWVDGVLAGKRPKPPRGRPKHMNIERDHRIHMALLVLQDLGVPPTVNESGDRSRSGCGIVARLVGLSYNGVARVWTDQRAILNEAAPHA